LIVFPKNGPHGFLANLSSSSDDTCTTIPGIRILTDSLKETEQDDVKGLPSVSPVYQALTFEIICLKKR
jgi:hypothetical protein